MSVKITDKMTISGKKFMELLEELDNKEVRIGFQAGENKEKDGTDICDIAAYNELGTDTIPSRPFLRDSVDNHESEINEMITQMRDYIINGGTAERVLKKFGIFQKKLIQEEIVSGDFAPNAEETIKRKGSDKPLIDTGRMRQSVNYVIEEKGGGR